MKTPGQVYSKEFLVKQVWKQEYDPAVHDNKIYVTIKRLRKLIEPEYEKPRYIFRAKNGYYLNKNTKVLLEQ
jgi:DNA-binding response OmpR family regulator